MLTETMRKQEHSEFHIEGSTKKLNVMVGELICHERRERRFAILRARQRCITRTANIIIYGAEDERYQKRNKSC